MPPSPGQQATRNENNELVPSNHQAANSCDATRHFLGALNTRRLGKRYRFRLTKASQGGFGIKIAERDNMYGSYRPIYITAITTTGSAYRDGRLKEGDMLLEINGLDLAGKSQPDVTRMLKEVPPEQLVEFVVSRQEPDSQSENTTISMVEPQQQQPQQFSDYQNIDNFPMALSQDQQTSPTNDEQQVYRETNAFDAPDLNSIQFERRIDNILDMPIIDGPGTYVYDIPLKDTNSAGLGLSLKYPRTADKKYLGIFIERVINGGAAWEDGRLQQDDQILSINGINLLNIDSYDETTNILQAAVGRGIGPEIPSPNTIRLKIHRRDPLIVAKLLYPYNNVNKNKQNQEQQATINSHYNHSSNNNSASFETTTSPQTQASISTDSNSSSHTSSAVSQNSNVNLSNKPNWDDDNESIEGEGKFIRDGFGRQSISEKRHAQLQAKDTDTFKRIQEKHIERSQLEQHQEILRHQELQQNQSQSQIQNIPMMNSNVIQLQQLHTLQQPMQHPIQTLPLNQHNNHNHLQQHYQQLQQPQQQYYQQQPQQQQYQQPAQYYQPQPQQLYQHQQHLQQAQQQHYIQQPQQLYQQLPQPIMVMDSNVNQAYQSFRHVHNPMQNQHQIQNGHYGQSPPQQMLNNQQLQHQIHHNNYHQNSQLMLNNVPQQHYSQHQLIQQHSSLATNSAEVSRLSRSESFRAALDRSFDVRIIDGPGTYIYDIPLRDSDSAGLGLSLKYPQTNDKKYLGVFIDSVLNGGAAWEDGRLQQNDQILSINGIDLLNIDTQQEAINILKGTIGRGLGPEGFPNSIRLKIHRRDPQLTAKILNPYNKSNDFKSSNNSYHNHNHINNHNNLAYDNSQVSPHGQATSNLYHQLGSLDRPAGSRESTHKKQEVAKRARKVHYFRVLSSCVNLIRQNKRTLS